MGGILVVLQFLIANRRADATEKTTKAQVKATQEQAKANEHTEKGQRQERLKNAIEHLGNDKASVRLGGAYELFHLAEETKEWRQTILDILCAYIRQTTGEGEYQESNSSKPSREVQNLLTMLFVQKHEVFRELRIDLQGSWLNGADLQGAHLDNAVLNGVNLRGAILWEAYLRGTDFIEAFLNGAGFGDANLQGSLLLGAKLYGATLCGAQLQGAVLTGAHLQGAYLNNAQLRGIRRSGEIDLLAFPRQTFAERMRASVDQMSDLSEVIFSGRLFPEDIDSIVEGFSEEDAQRMRERLQLCVGEPLSHEPLQGSGAVIRAYTKEEAEQWIAEYRTATSGGD